MLIFIRGDGGYGIGRGFYRLFGRRYACISQFSVMFGNVRLLPTLDYHLCDFLGGGGGLYRFRENGEV